MGGLQGFSIAQLPFAALDNQRGFEGFSVQQLPFLALEAANALKGFSVEALNAPLGGSNPNGQGWEGVSVPARLRSLNSLAFSNLLAFVTNPRLDELKVTLPDGRVFELGSNLAYGTISVPFCFFDEADEGEILVTGYRRATWPNPIGERFEYFETMI